MAEEYLRTARSETIEPATRAAAAQRIGTVVPTLPDTPVAPTATGDGSAGSGFQVVPEQYTAAVNPLHSMADQLSDMYTSLNSFLSQFDKPWGDDHAGKQFAEGDKGYIKYSTDILTVLKNLPKELRDTADGIKFMADNYEATEQAVVSGLTGQDQDLESSQGNYWSPSGYSSGTEISSTAASGPGYSMTSPDSLYDPVVADSPVTPRYESAGVPMETAQIPVEPRLPDLETPRIPVEPRLADLPVETPQIPVEPRLAADSLVTPRYESAGVPMETAQIPVEPRLPDLETPQIPVEPRLTAQHFEAARLEPAEVAAMPVETPQIPVEPRLTAQHFEAARLEPAEVAAMPVETPQIPVEPRLTAQHFEAARMQPAEVAAMPVETPQIPVEPRLIAEHPVAEPGPTHEGR